VTFPNTSLCLLPFLAVRKGEAIHMPDRGADHFASANRRLSVRGARFEVDAGRDRHSPPRGDFVFATLHWNALDADGQIARDTWTSYHLLATPDGPRRRTRATRQPAASKVEAAGVEPAEGSFRRLGREPHRSQEGPRALPAGFRSQTFAH
jgi:hypothetical protein